MIVQVCVGSACHLKGSVDIVEFLKQAVEKYRLETEITLAGSFCSGHCNREGVTVLVDDEVYTGLTSDRVSAFFDEKILARIERERM